MDEDREKYRDRMLLIIAACLFYQRHIPEGHTDEMAAWLKKYLNEQKYKWNRELIYRDDGA